MKPDTSGLTSNDLSQIIQILTKFEELEKCVLFGSRAKGNFKRGSDVDLAIWVSDNEITNQISGILNNETLLPYFFDIQNYNLITNQELKEHIDRVGIILFKREKPGKKR